ncbi:MAG: hypothetical protein IPK76_13245 [Lewinellaceae bacterium]|nr:hypothetical protein [Lewinellaceae bacterium]
MEPDFYFIEVFDLISRGIRHPQPLDFRRFRLVSADFSQGIIRHLRQGGVTGFAYNSERAHLPELTVGFRLKDGILANSERIIGEHMLGAQNVRNRLVLAVYDIDNRTDSAQLVLTGAVDHLPRLNLLFSVSDALVAALLSHGANTPDRIYFGGYRFETVQFNLGIAKQVFEANLFRNIHLNRFHLGFPVGFVGK